MGEEQIYQVVIVFLAGVIGKMGHMILGLVREARDRERALLERVLPLAEQIKDALNAVALREEE